MKIIVEVLQGVVNAVYADVEEGDIEVSILDHDIPEETEEYSALCEEIKEMAEIY